MKDRRHDPFSDHSRPEMFRNVLTKERRWMLPPSGWISTLCAQRLPCYLLVVKIMRPTKYKRWKFWGNPYLFSIKIRDFPHLFSNRVCMEKYVGYFFSSGWVDFFARTKCASVPLLCMSTVCSCCSVWCARHQLARRWNWTELRKETSYCRGEWVRDHSHSTIL